MIWIAVMSIVGMCLSAFFSGSETGFYRASRTRLALDALGGDIVSRSLIWLTNNPALFVATTLVGNNLANYMTSSAIVLAAERLMLSDSPGVQLLITVLLSPLIFVYGELLPKNLFLQAPNRLLRAGGSLFLLCTVLFSPLAAVLWLLGRVLQSLVGEAPERLQLTLARNELQRVFVEGHEVGILTPAQRQLADGMFAVAQESILRFSVPPARMASVHLGAAKADVLRLARRHGASTFLVTEARGRKWIGYVRVVDLYLSPGDYIENPRPLLTVGVQESPIAALTRMQSAKEPVACVVDRKGEILGVVGVRELTEPLLRSPKAAGAFL